VDYRRKLGNVVTEVDNIIALAAKQAESLAVETRQSLKEHIERSHKARRGEDRPRRDGSLGRATERCRRLSDRGGANLITAKLTPDRANELVSGSIKTLKALLK
jgi:F0F1-type ATP synthase membrane subunit b/b'